MSRGTASSRAVRCRLVVQQLVRPVLQHAAVEVRRQPPAPGVHYQPQVQPPMPLAHPERLAEQGDRPGHTHPPDEGNPPRRKRQPARRRSEEHTSELQSLRHLVCRLLLEKKKNTLKT